MLFVPASELVDVDAQTEVWRVSIVVEDADHLAVERSVVGRFDLVGAGVFGGRAHVGLTGQRMIRGGAVLGHQLGRNGVFVEVNIESGHGAIQSLGRS